MAFLYDNNENYEGIQPDLLFRETLKFCVSPGHRLALKEKVVPADLRHETFVYQHEDCCYYDWFQHLIETENLEIKDSVQVESGAFIKKYIMLGKGICILPKSMTDEEVQEEKLVYLNFVGEEKHISGRMLTLKDRWQSVALQAFIKFAKDYYPD